MPIPAAPRRTTSAALLTLLLGLMAPLAGCAMMRKYDLAQIHEQSAAQPERAPVIVIHGFLGSKLRNGSTHETVWGRFVDAITTSSEDDLALPIARLPLTENSDHLVPYALYESVGGVKFYGAMMDVLERAGRYRLGDIDNPKPGDNLFVFNYDWRRDNVESAQHLGKAIRQIKERLCEPDLRFDLVAHSMGGFVALYYAMYGTQDVLAEGRRAPVPWAGAPDLGRVVLLGAPLHGTMAAFRLLNTGLSRSLPRDVVFTMPSLYQLLPDDGESHFIDASGRPLAIDLYDAESWVRYGWSAVGSQRRTRRARRDNDSSDPDPQRLRFLQAALDRSRAFRSSLERADGSEPPIKVHVFGSDCIPTLDKAVVTETASGPATYFNDESTPDRNARRMEALLMAPGDGTVTAVSLTGAGRFSSPFFICESHGLLPANAAFQDNLFHLLFQAQDLPAAALRSAGSR
ncbi:MAG TPA: hypothetical protein VFB95_05435 [Candidatus Cryosericum sp.]|nr:hypothetical protein [Candidatus Cryosericum sp.]